MRRIPPARFASTLALLFFSLVFSINASADLILPDQLFPSSANSKGKGFEATLDFSAPPAIDKSNTTESVVCPPIDAKAQETPEDDGSTLQITWKPCPKPGVRAASEYFIYRAEKAGAGTSPVRKIAAIPATQELVEQKDAKGASENVYSFVDTGLSDAASYIYRVAAAAGQDFAYAFRLTEDGLSVNIGPVSPLREVIAYDKRAELAKDLNVAPPSDVTALDRPNDAGDALVVKWTPSADAEKVPGLVYRIYRSTEPDGHYEYAGVVGSDKSEFVDNLLPEDKIAALFFYIVAASDARGTKLAVSDHSQGVKAVVQWINLEEWNYLLFAVVLSLFVIYFIQHIKSGKKLFIRKIAGIEAVDEAIGRATEMGKPVLFIPGIMDMNDVQTIAGVAILGRVARTVAEYDAKLLCPTSRSLVMTTVREIVKEAYLSAGRPDAYHDDIVTYLTDEQFGYVAGVTGTMMRDRPATILYFGSFLAESLIMAETGNHIGAIQIAGTAQPAQIPFFVAACDYTLIGEELFAAAAYLSHDPKQLGSLKGQDIGKLLGMLGIALGSIFLTISQFSHAPWVAGAAKFIKNLFTAGTL